MNNIQNINVAVAESSTIVRSGLLSVLKKLENVTTTAVEISSMEGLHHCMRGHNLDIIFVNPSFEGRFNLKDFKAQYPGSSTKFIAILCSVTDMSLMKEYDESIFLYDDLDTLSKKIKNQLLLEKEEPEEEQETLSQREKEILCYIVKGNTNKEIADSLYLSIHTVITHRRNISRKLQIHSTAGLTIYAIVNKLVELKDVKM